MDVSERASEQAPTKLGLKPGQTLQVEDAIKGLVTRSANDAAVVIAEAIAGDEDEFAKLMTRKARALGMTKTVYRNASGLPNDDQITTARDQATLGRAIQDRFPRYYRYFATTTFVYKGNAIRNHNRLLGNVEGVDGIKTGYTRASGFNLVSSMRRGNRHLVGVVLGGRSGGSRDATMRSLLAENLEKGATKRTVAAINERGQGEANAGVADADAKPPAMVQVQGAVQVAAASEPGLDAMQAPRVDRTRQALADGGRSRQPVGSAQAEAQAKPEAGQAGARAVDQRRDPEPAACGHPRRRRADEAGPGQDGSSQGRPGEACLRRSRPAARVTNAIPPRAETAETSNAVVAKADKAEPAKTDLVKADPERPSSNGRRSSVQTALAPPCRRSRQVMAPAMACSACCRPPAPQPRPLRRSCTGHGICRTRQAEPQPAKHRCRRWPFSRTAPSSRWCPPPPATGWIVQVGALETESEAMQRIEAAKSQARGMLNKADSFTETVVAKDNRKLFRARFAGPRARSGGSRLPHAQARRHFLHHGPQLTSR